MCATLIPCLRSSSGSFAKFAAIRQASSFVSSLAAEPERHHLQSCEKCGYDEIERFYARNLPLSREMAINLQSFGGED
jgi:hypothetical protein